MVILLTNKSSTFRHALFKMIFVLNSFLTHLTLDHIHDIVVQIDGEILDTVNFATNKIDQKKITPSSIWRSTGSQQSEPILQGKPLGRATSKRTASA